MFRPQQAVIAVHTAAEEDIAKGPISAIFIIINVRIVSTPELDLTNLSSGLIPAQAYSSTRCLQGA
jgi:hypothetical protein